MKVLTVQEVLKMVGYRSPVSLYALERNGFPRRRQIGPKGGRVGWLSDEVEEYLRSCPVVGEAEKALRPGATNAEP